MFTIALDLLKEIHKLGYIAYIVGGYPRDKYRGKYTEDIDICTNMRLEEVQKNFEVPFSYPKLGSFKIMYKNTLFEVTTFRKEGSYLDYRHPSVVEFVDTLEEDLIRRDFVMNTLCIDQEGNYIDLLGSRRDIDKKMIRVVGNTRKKLIEDPLRIVRALRFSMNFGFALEEELKSEIERNKKYVEKISIQKIEEEIGKITLIENQEKVREILDLTNTKKGI